MRKWRKNTTRSGFLKRKTIETIKNNHYMIAESTKLEEKLDELRQIKMHTQHNSFLKICQKTDQEKIETHFDQKPLFQLRKWTLRKFYKLQKFIFLFVKNKVFEGLSLTVIIINMSLMILYDTNDPTSLVNRAEILFFVIFISEMCLKMLGMGLLSFRNGYFSDLWNWLDFSIVMFTGIDLILSTTHMNLSALRTLRVLRPLKTISSVKKLKTLILTIFGSLPFLLDIIFMLIFIYLIYAIAGIHLFSGQYQMNCLSILTLQFTNLNMVCGSDASCDPNSLCVSTYSSPSFGLISFDSLINALFFIHELITANGFNSYLSMITGSGIFMQLITFFYYISLIFFGLFLTVNLMLAVIVVKFTEANNNQLNKIEKTHDSHCICSKGCNFKQLKESGYLLSLSQLKKNLPFRTFMVKYVYTPTKEIDKIRPTLKVYPEYSFWMFKDSKILEARKKEMGDWLQSMTSQMQKRKKQPLDISRTKGARNKKAGKNNILLSSGRLRTPKEFSKRESSNEGVPSSDNDFLDKHASPKDYEAESEIFEKKDFEISEPKKAGRVLRNPKDQVEIAYNIDTNKLRFSALPNTLKIPTQLMTTSQWRTGSNGVKEVRRDDLTLSYDKQFESRLHTNYVPKIVESHEAEAISGVELANLPSRSHKSHQNTYSEEEEGLYTQTSFLRSKKRLDGLNHRYLEDTNKEEIEAVFHADILDLKVVFNGCSLFKAQKYLFPKKDVFPKLKESKIKTDLLTYNQLLVDISAKMRFDIRSVSFKEKGFKSHNEGNSSRQPKLSNVFFHKSSSRSELFVAIAGLPLHRDQTLKYSKYQMDFVRIKSFYYYSVKGNSISVGNKNTALSELSKDTQKNKLKLQRSRQMNLKQKSKNYQTIKKFFNDNFPTDESLNLAGSFPGCENEYNNKMYYFIIQRDANSGEIFNHNWSSPEVTTVRNNTQSKTAVIFQTLNNEVHDVWLDGFYGKVRLARRYATRFILSKASRNFFLTLVFCNVIFLSLDSITNSEYENLSNTSNFIFAALFISETLIKIFGLGVPQFSREWFNIVEFLITLVSAIELVISQVGGQNDQIRLLRIFRSIRVMRITKIFKSLKFMKIIGEVISDSLEHIFYIAMLLFLLLTIFAMIGNQLFSGQFTFYHAGEIKRQHFDDFFSSLIAVFSLMSLQNWDAVLIPIYRSSQNTAFGFIAMFAWMAIGNYILLNLFIAILLNGFSSHKSIAKKDEMENEAELISKLVKMEIEKEAEKNNKISDDQKKFTLDKSKSLSVDDTLSDPTNEPGIERQLSTLSPENGLRIKKSLDSNAIKMNGPLSWEDSSAQSDENPTHRFLNVPKTKPHPKSRLSLFCEESLYLFPRDNKLRIFISVILENPNFDRLTFFVILLSSLKLIVDSYQNASWEGTQWLFFLDILDFILNGYFILETTMKVIERGLFLPENAYLKKSWAVLDMLIVTTSIVEMIVSTSEVQFLQTLRALRAFRTLRFISHNRNLKLVVVSLLESISGIVNVSAVILLFWIMYSILGINLMSNRMGYCNFPDTRNYYYVNTTMCPDLGGVWSNAIWNFDNIFNAVVTLFGLSSLSNWEDYMFPAMDANDPSIGPIRHVNYWICLYYMFFCLISSMFLSNLFIGIIFYEYTNVQKKKKHAYFKTITDEQNRWLMMQKLIKQAEPDFYLIYLPKNKLHRRLFQFTHSTYLEYPMMGVIFLNTILLAMVYQNMNPLYATIISDATTVCVIIFMTESVVKILIQGPEYYFRQKWNRFDFCLAVLSVLDICLSVSVTTTTLGVYGQLGKLIKLIRITRILKLIKTQKLNTLNRIVQTLIFSLPALLNIFALLMLIYFFYAILGVALFKDVNSNFADFSISFIYTFKMSLGESWFVEMFASSQKNPAMAYIFFLTYIFVTLFVSLRMFVFVLIQQFENFYFSSDNVIDSFEEISTEFQATWLAFTTDAQGSKIHKKDLYSFFIALRAPLGFHIRSRKDPSPGARTALTREFFQRTMSNKESVVRKKITEMNLCHNSQGYISFGQVLHAALKKAFGRACFQKSDSHLLNEIRRVELKTIAKIFKKFLPKTERMLMSKHEATGAGQKRVRFANPFTAVVFSQILFKIWYRNSKRQLNLEDGLNDEYREMIDKNPAQYFEEKVRAVLKRQSGAQQGSSSKGANYKSNF